MIRGLNHITLAVSDIERSVRFYRDVLGLVLAHTWERGAYLRAGDLWLALALTDDVKQRDDYTHFAFDVAAEDFRVLCDKLSQNQCTPWQINTSEGDSYYFFDPDNHRLEIHVGDLQSRLAAISQSSHGVTIPCSF